MKNYKKSTVVGTIITGLLIGGGCIVFNHIDSSASSSHFTGKAMYGRRII